MYHFNIFGLCLGHCELLGVSLIFSRLCFRANSTPLLGTLPDVLHIRRSFYSSLVQTNYNQFCVTPIDFSTYSIPVGFFFQLWMVFPHKYLDPDLVQDSGGLLSPIIFIDMLICPNSSICLLSSVRLLILVGFPSWHYSLKLPWTVSWGNSRPHLIGFPSLEVH